MNSEARGEALGVREKWKQKTREPGPVHREIGSKQVLYGPEAPGWGRGKQGEKKEIEDRIYG